MSDETNIIVLDEFKKNVSTAARPRKTGFLTPFDNEDVLIEIGHFLSDMDFKSISVCDRESGRTLHASRIEVDAGEEIHFWSPDEGKVIIAAPG